MVHEPPVLISGGTCGSGDRGVALLKWGRDQGVGGRNWVRKLGNDAKTVGAATCLCTTISSTPICQDQFGTRLLRFPQRLYPE